MTNQPRIFTIGATAFILHRSKETTPEFYQELIKAARHQIDKPTVIHKYLVPGCWRQPQTLPSCMEVGLDETGFNCSGLVIHAVATVLDIRPTDWPHHLRHTRQMWQAADSASPEGFIRDPAGSIGSLLVMRRRWTINGEDIPMPAHIGIVSGIDNAGTPIVIQAHAGEGRVIERPLLNTKHVMGAITLTGASVPTPKMLAGTLDS